MFVGALMDLSSHPMKVGVNGVNVHYSGEMAKNVFDQSVTLNFDLASSKVNYL